MSKSFIINMSVILVFFGLTFLFPDFFAKGYQYLKINSYLFVVIFNLLLLSIYLLSIRDFKIKYSKLVTFSLILIGSSTLTYAYICNSYISTKIASAIVILTMFIVGFNVQKKITK